MVMTNDMMMTNTAISRFL